jgi:hypothetical protein
MSENKPGKYFKYAIGEIVLVVIGILIALSINNWNEQRKQNKLESEYYCRLLEDVVLDKEQVNKIIIKVDERLKSANNAVRLLNNKEVLKTDVSKELGYSINAIISDFTPNKSAFEDLKSGANLNIIKDKTIIKSLNNYFKKVEGHLSIVEVNGRIALDRFFSYKDLYATGWVHFSMNGSFINGMEKDVYEMMQLNYEETLSDDIKFQLLNDALRYISSNTRQKQLYNFILEEADILINLLESKCSKTHD